MKLRTFEINRQNSHHSHNTQLVWHNAQLVAVNFSICRWCLLLLKRDLSKLVNTATNFDNKPREIYGGRHDDDDDDERYLV